MLGIIYLGWNKWYLRNKNYPVSLEKEMATHSRILAWRIPKDRGTWWATVHGVAKSLTQLSDFMFTLKTLMLIEISKSKRTNTVWFCVLGTQRSQTGRNSRIMIARGRGLGRRLKVYWVQSFHFRWWKSSGDDGGNRCTTMSMYLMPWNCGTEKWLKQEKIYVIYILLNSLEIIHTLPYLRKWSLRIRQAQDFITLGGML